jgi:NAD(P)-dependent dehydrogenase (short-subunit alcohol dehydrogenase family)
MIETRLAMTTTLRDSPVTVVTGANKGIGLETVRRLVGAGHLVYLGARDAERGHAAADAAGAEFVELDVTSDDSVGRAAAIVERAEAAKSAINMLTVRYAQLLPEIRINAADPGLTATDLSSGQGHSVQSGTDAIVAFALSRPDGPTGAYRDLDGDLPW